MDNKPVKKPKKRGRKPKEKVNETPIHIGNEVQVHENMVIRLKHTTEETLSSIISYDGKEESGYKAEKISEVCWNCCHPFHSIVTGIPLKHTDQVFYVYGDFCSLECGSRYAYENYNEYFRDIISLINLYNCRCKECICDPIKIAPNRLFLKMFGGSLSIDEYRENNNSVTNVIIPPIIPIKHVTESIEINHGSSKSNYKLCRKKPIKNEKKDISNSMNLIINNN